MSTKPYSIEDILAPVSPAGGTPHALTVIGRVARMVPEEDQGEVYKIPEIQTLTTNFVTDGVDASAMTVRLDLMPEVLRGNIMHSEEVMKAMVKFVAEGKRMAPMIERFKSVPEGLREECAKRLGMPSAVV